jgi:hypothetical protein
MLCGFERYLTKIRRWFWCLCRRRTERDEFQWIQQTPLNSQDLDENDLLEIQIRSGYVNFSVLQDALGN